MGKFIQALTDSCMCAYVRACARQYMQALRRLEFPISDGTSDDVANSLGMVRRINNSQLLGNFRVAGATKAKVIAFG